MLTRSSISSCRSTKSQAYRARETYTILSRDEFTERFEIAEPGKDFEL